MSDNIDNTVSLLMVVRNGAQFIRAAIESVEAQTHQAWELLIVDDGSSDDSRAVIGTMVNDRVRLVSVLDVNTGHRGIGFVRNIALAASKGCFVGAMDADDLRYPQSLALQLQCLLDSPKIVGASGPHDEIDSVGHPPHIERDVTKWRRRLVRSSSEEIQRLARRGEGGRRCPFAPSLTLLRARLVEAVGGYDESLRYHVDSDLHCRLAARGSFAYGSDPLGAIRMHPNQLSIKKRDENWQRPCASRVLPAFDRRSYQAFLS